MAKLKATFHVKKDIGYDELEITTSADGVTYGGGTSGLSATDVQGAIDELASEKLDKVGDAKDTTVTFTEAVTLANVNSGESNATLWGKVKKMFSFIGTTALTTTAQTITTAINELNTNLSMNFLNGSANLKQVKMDFGEPLITFTNGVGSVTLNQSYTNANAIGYVLNGGYLINNSAVSGTTLTFSVKSLTDVPLNGQVYIRYHVIGY